MDSNFRVILTGGGSGGHIYPLIAVADALQKKAIELKFDCEMIYIGQRDAFAPLFEARGIRIETIAVGKVRRYFSLDNLFDIPKFFIGFIQALWTLYKLMPDVIFSKGGPGAFPVVVAGWFYRVPVVIHESDAIPGSNNAFSAHFAQKIFVSFAAAVEKFGGDKNTIGVTGAASADARIEVSGAPIRTELLPNSTDPSAVRTTPELAKESLGFSSSHPLILILGGSQGSLRINNFILTNLPAIIAETQVLHQTGVANFVEAQKLSRAALWNESATANRYLPVNYFTDNLAMAYTAADIIIARSGSTVFEMAAFAKPAILIPLAESANDHQRADAYAFAEVGAGVVIEEENLLPGIFLNELKRILSDKDTYKKMCDASAKFFIPGAAEKIADAIIKLGA